MSQPPTDTTLRETLRAAGLRATSPRVAVLRALHGEGPTTHAEVFTTLAEHGWDRATLYRNLVDLTEAGLLRRVDLGDHVWRYELVSTPVGATHEAAEHPHFLCTTCGELACLPDVRVELPTSGIPASLVQGSVSIQFRGVCDRCQPAV